MFRVKRKNLLLIAGTVWFMAGFNVAPLGLLSYGKVEGAWYLYLLSLLIFVLFGKMFFNMTEKHTERALSYEKVMPFWCFFDKKIVSYHDPYDEQGHRPPGSGNLSRNLYRLFLYGPRLRAGSVGYSLYSKFLFVRERERGALRTQFFLE